jgi:hypothetical protein
VQTVKNHVRSVLQETPSKHRALLAQLANGGSMKGFPTIEEVKRLRYRFLRCGETAAHQKIVRRIAERV